MKNTLLKDAYDSGMRGNEKKDITAKPQAASANANKAAPDKPKKIIHNKANSDPDPNFVRIPRKVLEEAMGSAGKSPLQVNEA